MTTLYHVFTKLTLQDGVSKGLLLLSTRFSKTNKEALLLQKRISRIKTTLLAGAGLTFMGGMGLVGLSKMLKPASEYLHTLTQANAVGMKHVEVANMVKAAWEATSKVQTVSVTEALQMGIALRRILGSTTAATALLPEMARFKTAFVMAKESGKLGAGVDATQMVYTAAKAAEMAGATGDRARFDKFMNNMIRVVVGTAGRVTPMMYMGLLKYARGAGMSLSDTTLFRTAPILMEEMALGRGGAGGGARGGPGAIFNAFYRMMVQGVMTKQTTAGFQSLGLLTGGKPLSTAELVKYQNMYKQLLAHPLVAGAGVKKGLAELPLVGAKMAATDPVEWVLTYLKPALKKEFPTLGRKELASKAALYFRGNTMAAWLASNVIAREWQIRKEMRMLGAVPGTKSLMDLSKQDPDSAATRLKIQWHNMMIALGKPLMTLLIPAGNKLASVLNGLAVLFEKFPALGLGLTTAFGALAASMAIGGTIMLLTAAFGGLNIALGALGVSLTIGALATGIGEVAIALTALYEIVKHWKDIVDFFTDKHKGSVKKVGMHTTMMGLMHHKYYIPLFHHDQAAMANKTGVHIRPPTEHQGQGNIMMDGQKVGNIVMKHMGNALSRGASNQRSNFDIGMHIPSVNYSL